MTHTKLISGVKMKKSLLTLGVLAATLATPVLAVEGTSPVTGIQHLDHVFVIMMENHGYSQIIGNPAAPYTNQLAESANLATNYFAVGHPSLTNYLEVVGGSNFGVLNDNSPDWHNKSCVTNLASGVTSYDNGGPNICPFTGTGKDAATVAVDKFNETTPPSINAVNNIDGHHSISQASNISAKTIADQLVQVGKTWKTYQESIPLDGNVDGVNKSDDSFSNLTDFNALSTPLISFSSSDLVGLYAVKHNPFAYFQNIQTGTNSELSLQRVVGFDALYGDLATGNAPTYSFIVPNQCNDQHGRGNASPFCAYDPLNNGSVAGLNPAGIKLGDDTIQKLVTSIQKSPVWKNQRSAIVILWDENDYSGVPNTNQVPTIIVTNNGVSGLKSNRYYNHFSLLKTIEGALGLPCLNHACDADVHAMWDLFDK